MKLRGQLTSDKAYEAVARLTEEMGKSPAVCARPREALSAAY